MRAAYKAGRVGVSALVGAGGAVTTTATIADVAPGLNVTVLGTLPDVAGTAKVGRERGGRKKGVDQNGASIISPLFSFPPPFFPSQLGLDYVVPHLHAKALIGLNATPKVDVAATTGVRDGALGVQAAYDTAKGALTAWSVGSSRTRPDYQASALLTDR